MNNNSLLLPSLPQEQNNKKKALIMQIHGYHTILQSKE